jgi:hypothetical protein
MAVISGIGLLACNKENPFVSKDIIDKLVEDKKIKLYNIAFIYNNDIYLLPRQDSAARRITSTPDQIKTNIRISHDHQKFAYINTNGNPVIINKDGSIQSVLTQYSNIQSMDWSPNDSTLYMLIYDSLKFFGPSIQLPEFTYPGALGSIEISILSVSVSMHYDLAYIFQYYNFLEGYKQKLIIKKHDGSVTEKTNMDSQIMGYVNFSGNNTDLVVGYSYYSPVFYMDKIELYSELKDYPDHTFEYGDSYNFVSYRSDVKYMVCSHFGSNSTNYTLLAFSFVDNTNFNFTQYNDSTNRLYVDWK